MTKEEQFLLLAQSAFLAASIRRAQANEKSGANPALVLAHMGFALDASTKIPSYMEVQEAAREFCAWLIDDYERPEWV